MAAAILPRMAGSAVCGMPVKTKRPTSVVEMTDLDALADSETGSDPDGEIRHLKSTIAALRQALEDGEAERDALRQGFFGVTKRQVLRS